MAKTRTKPEADVLTIPVAYGDVGVGDQIARLTVHIDRKRLTLAQADKLCGKRLVVRITCTAGNDNPDQPALPDAEAETTMAGACDVKRFGFGPKSISTSLSFSIASIDLPTLCGFAKRAGSVTVDAVTEIPAGDADDE